MVFHRFSIGSGARGSEGSLKLSLGWPSVWGAKCVEINMEINDFP